MSSGLSHRTFPSWDPSVHPQLPTSPLSGACTSPCPAPTHHPSLTLAAPTTAEVLRTLPFRKALSPPPEGPALRSPPSSGSSFACSLLTLSWGCPSAVSAPMAPPRPPSGDLCPPSHSYRSCARSLNPKPGRIWDVSTWLSLRSKLLVPVLVRLLVPAGHARCHHPLLSSPTLTARASHALWTLLLPICT